MCHLRAYSKRLKDWFVFEPQDVPVLLRTNQFVLANRPRSPVLQLQTLQIGCDVAGIYSGGRIEADGKIHDVIWDKGIVTSDGKPLYDFHYVKPIVDDTPVNHTQKLSFVCDGVYYSLQNFCGMVNDKVVTTSNDIISPKDIKLGTGMYEDSRAIGLGDYYCGEVVTMLAGSFVIPVADGMLDIKRGTILNMKEGDPWYIV